MREALELLKDLSYEVLSGSEHTKVGDLVYDTRKVKIGRASCRERVWYLV